MAYKGINWGRLSVGEEGIVLGSMSNNSSMFSLDFKSINNSTVNKNDIIIETTTEELNNDDCMCEIRFHVETQKEEADAENNEKGENAEGEGE